jgi:hypothetical protein
VLSMSMGALTSFHALALSAAMRDCPEYTTILVRCQAQASLRLVNSHTPWESAEN